MIFETEIEERKWSVHKHPTSDEQIEMVPNSAFLLSKSNEDIIELYLQILTLKQVKKYA